MFNRRSLTVSAATAVLAVSGVLGTALAANAATVGPMQPTVGSQQAQPGSQPGEMRPGPVPAQPATANQALGNVVSGIMTALASGVVHQ